MISLCVEIKHFCIKKSINNKTNFKIQLFEAFVLGAPPSVLMNEKENEEQ